jgi:hypothetical protein
VTCDCLPEGQRGLAACAASLREAKQHLDAGQRGLRQVPGFIDGGVETFYKYDNTPPHPPELTIQIIDERYFRIGARIPTDQGSDQVKEIRVLVSRTGYPAGPLGSGFVTKPSTVYPNEPFSSFFYNHADRTLIMGR